MNESEEVVSSNPNLESDAENVGTDLAVLQCDTETVMSDSNATSAVVFRGLKWSMC